MRLVPALCALFLLPATAHALDDEADMIVHGHSRSHEMRIHLGLAQPLLQLELEDIEIDGQATRDEERNFDMEPGIMLDAEWVWTHLNESRIGWMQAYGVALGWHRAEDEDNGDEAEAFSATATWRIGLVMRWDNVDELAALRHLRFELSPVLGLGATRLEIDGSDESGYGALLRYGILFETVADWRGGWNLNLGLGWMGDHAWLDWDNTDGSTARFGGVVARIGTGFYF